MKIYNFINFTNNTNSITCDIVLAEYFAEKRIKEGHKIQLWEGNLKTQGSNYCTWANNWKLIKESKTK